MKRLLPLLLLPALLFCRTELFGQSMTECRKAVEATVEAVNRRDIAGLRGYLAPDFSCAKQTGAIAVRVLEMIVAQLNEEISETALVSEQQTGEDLTLVYDFNYKTRGHRNVTFVFGTDNRIKRLELVAAEVKTVSTQTEFAQPSWESMAIPFELHGNLIIVSALLNGTECDFILDSGAPTLILNSAAFADDTVQQSASSMHGVNSDVRDVGIVRIDSFDFNGIRTCDKEFATADLSHLVEGRKIYGLIGCQVIKEYDWLFDYKARTLTLIKPDKTSDYIVENGFLARTVPLFMASGTSHMPCVEGEVDGMKITLGVDCGATANLFDTPLWEILQGSLKKRKTTDMSGVSGTTTVVREALVRSMSIGDTAFKNLRTVFSDLTSLRRNWSEKVSGIVGFELLSRQKAIVSIAGKKMIFIE